MLSSLLVIDGASKRFVLASLANTLIMGCGGVFDGKKDESSEASIGIAVVQQSSSSAIDDRVSIQMAFPDAPITATWDLYYGTQPGQLENLKAIAKQLPVSDLKLEWQSSLVAEGSYYLVAILSYKGQDSVYWYSQPVVIERDSVDPPPVVSFEAPVGDHLYYDGDDVTIRYAGVSGTGGELTYKVEYSPDGGASWSTIAETADTEVVWTISGLAQGVNYRLRVVATDTTGKEGSVQTSGVLAIASQQVTYEMRDDIGGQVKQALEAHCQPCHSADHENSRYVRVDRWDDFTLPDGLDGAGVNTKRQSLVSRTRKDAANPMPPDGTLDDSVRDLLLIWELAGYPRYPKR